MTALSTDNFMGNVFYGGCFLMITGTIIITSNTYQEQSMFEDVGGYTAICGIIGSGFAAFYFLLRFM